MLEYIIKFIIVKPSVETSYAKSGKISGQLPNVRFTYPTTIILINKHTHLAVYTDLPHFLQ